MPERLQRKRTRGWKKPDGAVCVSRPGRWGNPHVVKPTKDQLHPYAVGERGFSTFEAAARHASMLFESDLRAGRLRVTVADARRELADRSLCCFCPLPNDNEPDHCHGAVLLRLSNQPPRNQ